MRQNRIYPVSRSKHRKMWLYLRDNYHGLFNIRATWLNVEDISSVHSPSFVDQCIQEASESNIVMYCAPDDSHFALALVEIGACLSSGGSVHIIGGAEHLEQELRMVLRHPRVRVWSSDLMYEAFVAASKG